MNIYSFIKLSHLPALGLGERNFIIFLLVIGIVIVYMFTQPFISWLVSLKMIRLLSYVVSSLLILNIVCFIIILRPDLTESILIFVGFVLQIIALFGIGLIIYYTFCKLIGRI